MRRKLRKKRKRVLRKRIASIILLGILAFGTFLFIKNVVLQGPMPYKKYMPIKVKQISVYFTDKDEVKTMDLEEYLKGVVTAEMPAEFDSEALKAQAVAARTYIVRKIKTNTEKNPNDVHKGADVCTNPAHCEAYRDPNSLSKEFINNYWKKISNAVESTKGQILLYRDEPIDAVFFAISGGKTENSKDAWGGDLPYLKSVDSSIDENAPDFETTVEVSMDEFKKKIQEQNKKADFKKHPLIENIARSEGGSVMSADIGGVSFKGSEIRQIFDLRSANFNIKNTDKQVTFDVKGYGHGVGMSQWGANLLAKSGKKYDEILKNYYQDVEICKMDE